MSIHLQNLASIQPRTSLVKFARSSCTNPLGTCRIGNWNEDIELEEIRLKDYLKKKEQGNLVVLEKQAKLEKSLQPATLSVPDDGLLHFGMTAMVFPSVFL